MAAAILNFLPFRLDLANEQLWREEQCIALRPKTFAILRYLAEHPNRLVTKDELLRAVWGDTQVSEEGLRDYLREIRRTLGDDAEAPHFVETVRGRGYRFLPTVTTPPVASPKSQVPSQSSALTPNPQSLTPSLPLPDNPSIIVLPFLNLSNDPEQEYFSDGITEDMTNSLSRLSSLFVISRTSAFTYKGKPTKVQDVSKEMGVQYVLEGSVRRADNQIRVTVQLIDAITDHHLWSERYDRPLTDIFAVQDEIVQKIVTTLKLQLSLWEKGIFVRKRTDSIEAYDFWLRGMESVYRFTPESNIQAQQMFEKALALDSQYAQAYASLGMTHFRAIFYQWSQDPHHLAQAFEVSQKAVRLGDSLPQAHTTLAWILLMDKQHEKAIAEAERALALDPNNAEGYRTFGCILCFAGQPERAARQLEKAMRLNPHSPPLYLNDLGWAYYWEGRREEALSYLQQALSRDPNHLPARLNLACFYSELGRDEEARAEAVEVLRLSPQFSLEKLRQQVPFKDQSIIERGFISLRKAGLK